MANSSSLHRVISTLLCNPFNFAVISAFQEIEPLGPTNLYGIHGIINLPMNLEGKRLKNFVIQYPMAVSSDSY